MSRRFAQDPSVSTDKSLAEVRSTIKRYGASEFAHMEGDTQAVVMFTMNERRVMFRVKMPDLADFKRSPEKRLVRSPAAAHAA